MKNLRYLVLSIVLSLFSFPSLACSFVGYYYFQPTLERWEMHPGPKQSDENSDGAYWEPVPLPVVENIEINRATYEGKNSCRDTGVLTLVIKLPSTSTYDLDEFGVYFHVIDGDTPDTIFPDTPIISVPNRETASFTFPWLDTHPSKQGLLNLSVEVRFVTNELNLGAPTVFKIEQIDG